MAARKPEIGDVSTIICAHTEERWRPLLAAVESVRQQSIPAREIIVVIDNNPVMAERARAALPDARVLENNGQRGAGAARNTAAEVATGEFLAFLDDDAVASPTWIADALQSLADASVLGVGGTITPIWEADRPAWFPDEFNWVVGCTYPGLPTATAPVRNLIAANMFVHRASFLDIGGFRAGFGKTGGRSGTDETELCIRATRRWPDRIWLYNPAVSIGHRVPLGRVQRRYFLLRCYDEGVAKAMIVEIAGAQRGLSAERQYTRVVLPQGVLRNVRSFVVLRELSALGRAVAIVVGLMTTVIGYGVGRSARSLHSLRARGPGAFGGWHTGINSE
jgi:glycosyltransferase involved in cell wall biosynthesis